MNPLRILREVIKSKHFFSFDNKNYSIKKEKSQELDFIKFMIFFERRVVKINQNLNKEIEILIAQKTED